MKNIFALGDAPANPDALAKYNFRKKHSFPLYSEASLLSGMEATLKLPLIEKMFERAILLNVQMEEVNSATD